MKVTLAGLRPGVYKSSYLYARYSEAMRLQGREPVHPVRLGQLFVAHGLLRARSGGKNAWRL